MWEFEPPLLPEDPVGDILEGPITCRADQLLSILILLAEVTEEWLEPVDDVSLFIKLTLLFEFPAKMTLV